MLHCSWVPTSVIPQPYSGSCQPEKAKSDTFDLRERAFYRGKKKEEKSPVSFVTSQEKPPLSCALFI